MPCSSSITPEYIFNLMKEKNVGPGGVMIEVATGGKQHPLPDRRKAEVWVAYWDGAQWVRVMRTEYCTKCSGDGFKRVKADCERDVIPQANKMWECWADTSIWAKNCKNDPALATLPVFKTRLKDFCKQGANWSDSACQTYCRTPEGLADPDCKEGYRGHCQAPGSRLWMPTDLGGERNCWEFAKAAKLSLGDAWSANCGSKDLLGRPECMGENSYACSTNTAGGSEFERGHRFSWCTDRAREACKKDGYKDKRCSCLKPFSKKEEAFLNEIGANGTRYCLSTPHDEGAGLACKQGGYVPNVQEKCQDICALVAKAQENSSVILRDVQVNCNRGETSFSAKQPAPAPTPAPAAAPSNPTATPSAPVASSAPPHRSPSLPSTEESAPPSEDTYNILGSDVNKTTVYIVVAVVVVAVLCMCSASGGLLVVS